MSYSDKLKDALGEAEQKPKPKIPDTEQIDQFTEHMDQLTESLRKLNEAITRELTVSSEEMVKRLKDIPPYKPPKKYFGIEPPKFRYEPPPFYELQQFDLKPFLKQDIERRVRWATCDDLHTQEEQEDEDDD